MNSDHQGNPWIPDSQHRFEQKEGKVWQAPVLISLAFVEPLRETLFHSPGSIRGEFLEHSILQAIPEFFIAGISLTILHKVQDQCISCSDLHAIRASPNAWTSQSHKSSALSRSASRHVFECELLLHNIL